MLVENKLRFYTTPRQYIFHRLLYTIKDKNFVYPTTAHLRFRRLVCFPVDYVPVNQLWIISPISGY